MTKIGFKKVGFILAVSLLGACGKKDQEAPAAVAEALAAEAAAEAAPAEPAAPAPLGIETMPGENGVRSALASKNYEGAVAQLVAMKNGIPAEMWSTYVSFFGEVRNDLADAAEKDPKAAQALMVMRGMTAGR